MELKEIKEIIEITTRNDISQTKAAKQMGISPGYWWEIRSGRRPATKDVLEKIKTLKKKLKAFEAA